MKILILGGTRFLGYHLAEAAVTRSHDVTLFHRGKTASSVAAGASSVLGDRFRDLDRVQDGGWDAVIDTCGYLPDSVRSAAETVRESVRHYTFVSSLSVYSDFSKPGLDESGPLATMTEEQLAEAQAVDTSRSVSALSFGPAYGPLKVLCERAAEEVLPNRVLHVRAGLIVGPRDYTDRFTYWPVRVARGGDVLAPGRPERPIQFIDARDLATWILDMAERGETGTFNADGPARAVSMEQLVTSCREVSGADSRIHWVADSFLVAEDVAPWSEIPLWIPEEAIPEMKGFMEVDCRKAAAAGLRARPVSQTVADTLAWHRTLDPPPPLQAGLSKEREAELLRRWQERVQG